MKFKLAAQQPLDLKWIHPIFGLNGFTLKRQQNDYIRKRMFLVNIGIEANSVDPD